MFSLLPHGMTKSFDARRTGLVPVKRNSDIGNRKRLRRHGPDKDLVAERRFARGFGRPVIAEKAAVIRKGQFEKIKGTRIQISRCGKPVRIVISDGKQFPPDNVQAVNLYMKRLAQQAEEHARAFGEPLPSLAAAPVPAPKTAAATGAAPAKKKVVASNGKQKSDPTGKDQEKKAGPKVKDQEKRLRQRARQAAEAGRQVVCPPDWCKGEVVQRAKGRAWVRLDSATELSGPVLSRLQAVNAELRAKASATEESPFRGGDEADLLLPVAFFDVAEQGLMLQPGTKLRFKLFTDNHGVGGCEATSA